MNRARGHVCRPTRPPQHQETSVGPSPPCVRMPTATLKALFSRVQFRTEKCSRKPGGRGSDVCDRQRSAGPNLPSRAIFSPRFGPTPEIAHFGPFLPGRGLKSPAGTNQISDKERTCGNTTGRVTHGRLVRRSRAREGGPRIVLCNVITGLVRHN